MTTRAARVALASVGALSACAAVGYALLEQAATSDARGAVLRAARTDAEARAAVERLLAAAGRKLPALEAALRVEKAACATAELADGSGARTIYCLVPWSGLRVVTPRWRLTIRAVGDDIRSATVDGVAK